ncbi:HAMP domain-containing histidine kinase, partial [bacterium]|nr:HAMP domain-containing histidine kinase [bacterium]
MRDHKELLEKHALGYAKTTKDQLCNHWRLYYRSGAYKFRDIIRTQMGLNEDLYRLFILSVSGEVLFDSMESPDLMLLPEIPKRRLADEDLVTVAGLQEPWFERRELAGVGPVFMVSAPYFEEWGRHPYSVLYIFKYDKVWERVQSDLRSTLLLVLIALATVAAFASWMAGRVARPLLGLTESVRSFSEGKLDSLPLVRTGDEIESLAEAFNRMAERIKLQVERLETANRELATLDRMKTDLLANVSHELRTPLAAIRGYVEFIQEGQLGPTTDAQRKGLEVCLRNSERLTKTINMLLDFSRMELGRVPIRPAPFQIGRLLAQIVAGIEADARKRRVSLRTVVDRDLKPVDGDRDRLTQVLENLITNALKFTPDGGEVEVGARPAADGRRVEVWVADTGIGIPPEERSRVFDKFYQTDASATRKFGGIGLGLAIVKSILDAHGADIVVDGRPGAGSIFRFSLPIAETQTESGVFQGLVTSAGSAADVLAIDDDPDFLAI